MKRKDFISSTAILATGYSLLSKFTLAQTSSLGENISFPLHEHSIDMLQEFMRSRKYSAVQITQLYLDRIAAIDKKGPKLNSIIEINPDALSIAKQCDEERMKGKVRGPLHGIPVLIKDNIDTADKMMTTAGALALMNNKADKDAFLVSKLRQAGAVLLGKTNLSEWANFRSTRSVSGWSSRGGQTRNPYSLDRNPCGSSSGSAAAVSANLCAITIGTETNGSINCPASVNGVVGIKPSVGLVSRAGIIPISKTQDTAGPITRTVRDAAIVLSSIIGKDNNDIATQTKENSPTDFTTFLNADALAGKTIGVEKNFLSGGHEGVLELYNKAIAQMKSKGAKVIEVDFLSAFGKIGVPASKVMQYEFKDGVNKYLAQSNVAVKNLTDVIRFNKENEARAMPFFKQELLEACQSKGDLNEKDYTDALLKYDEARKFYQEFFAAQQLDAICGPSNGTAWCTDLVNGDRFTGYGMYGPAAVCGCPSINVPMGFVHGLPVGMAFLGKAFKDGELIAIAYSYEQASKNRRAPKLVTLQYGSSTPASS